MGFLDASVVKNLPAVQELQEIWVQSLGQEDPLEDRMGYPLQYSCLGNPWTGGLQSIRSQSVRHN